MGGRWKTEEDQLIIDKWFEWGAHFLGHELNRSPDAVTRRAGRLNATKHRRGGYSSGDIDFLKKHAGTMRTHEIAAALNKSIDSIQQKAHKLGLSLRFKKQ